MKATHFCAGILLVFCGGWAGYNLHRTGHSGSFLGPETTPQLEYFARPESFSRVENTKATLEALSRRMLLESENNLLAAQKLPPDSAQEQKRAFEVISSDLERGMHEFAGTDQELDFAQDLLMVLKRGQDFGRWMEVYLKALYEHPAHPVVIRLAKEALIIGRTAGRENEVVAALEHVQTIPFDFEGKRKIAAVLADAGTHRTVTRFDASKDSRPSGS